MSKKKIIIPVRVGMPTSCIACNGVIHRKSEHYCSKHCENVYKASTDEKKPPFRSKWKERKLKEAKDPLIRERKKVRRKTNDLIKAGKLKRKACVVCGKKTVLPHHEDYSNPFKIIWLCEEDHKDYHDGKIALYNGQLKWDPARLTKTRGKINGFPKKKYQQLMNYPNFKHVILDALIVLVKNEDDLLKAIVEDKRFTVNNFKDGIFAEVKVARKTTNREP